MITNLAEGVQAFTSNVFLVEGERTVLIDPGNGFDVVSRIETRVDGLDAVLLTHTHPDHVGNLEAVTSAFGVEAWGFDPEHPGLDRSIDDGERIAIGDHEYVALHTPGHKDDHLCFYTASPGVLFSGDLVFADGGFGRTDLEEGHRGRLVESIDRVLNVVDELDRMYAGHGPIVTENPRSDVETARRMAEQL